MPDSPCESAARIPTFDDTFIDAFAKAMTTYTVGPGNVERVIDLTVNDIVAALRPVVEAKVRWHYEAVR